jgi:hypothetical protein
MEFLPASRPSSVASTKQDRAPTASRAALVAAGACLMAVLTIIGSAPPVEGADPTHAGLSSECRTQYLRIHKAVTGDLRDYLRVGGGTALPYDGLEDDPLPAPSALPELPDPACLEPFETVFVVGGVPVVSGLYRSGRPVMDDPRVSGAVNAILFGYGDMTVTGAGIEASNPDGAPVAVFDMQPGRCYVGNQGEAFTTVGEVVHQPLLPRVGWDEDTGLPRMGEPWSEGANALTSISVGVTVSGEPFMDVWRAVGPGGYGVDREVVYQYLPGAYAQNAVITWRSERRARGDNRWAGVASFSSLTYNDRDFSPWSDIYYQGAPAYTMQITLFCG